MEVNTVEGQEMHGERVKVTNIRCASLIEGVAELQCQGGPRTSFVWRDSGRRTGAATAGEQNRRSAPAIPISKKRSAEADGAADAT